MHDARIALAASLLKFRHPRGTPGHEAVHYQNAALRSRVIIILIRCSVALHKEAQTLSGSTLRAPTVKLIYTEMIKNLIYFTTDQ